MIDHREQKPPLYQPTFDEVRNAVQSMLENGLSLRDVADVLRADVQQIRRIAGYCQDCA